MNGEILAAILVGLFEFVSIGALAVVFLLYAKRAQARLEARVMGELARLVAGEPCQSAAILNAAGHLIGQEAGRSAKMALMSDLSHASRDATHAATDGALAEISQANPTVGALLGGMGKNKAKGLLANPVIQLAIQGFLANANKQGGGGGSNGGQPPKQLSL